MPFNGSGTYSPPGPPTFPAIPGTTITSAYFNATINDLAEALSLTLTRDGQSLPTNDIDWGNKALSNVSVFTCTTGFLNGGLIWSSSNDGPGSGLNADFLDGVQGFNYVLQTDYTAAAVLAKVLTVDGSGSGLDADLLGGTPHAQYAKLASANFTTLQIGGVSAGYLGLPSNPQNVAYQLVLTDQGKHVYYTGAAAALTVPANATVAFPVGSAVTVVNNGSGVLTITRAGGVVMKWAGVGTDANRALAVGGMATLLKVATDTWFISGAGLS